MGGGRQGNFMDQPGGRGRMSRYPEGGREFSRPDDSQFPGGSRGDRRQAMDTSPPPQSEFFLI